MAQTAPMEARKDAHPRRARLLIVEDDARLRRALELLDPAELVAVVATLGGRT